jgi:hypothetical protein
MPTAANSRVDLRAGATIISEAARRVARPRKHLGKGGDTEKNRQFTTDADGIHAVLVLDQVKAGLRSRIWFR